MLNHPTIQWSLINIWKRNSNAYVEIWIRTWNKLNQYIIIVDQFEKKNNVYSLRLKI